MACYWDSFTLLLPPMNTFLVIIYLTVVHQIMWEFFLIITWKWTTITYVYIVHSDHVDLQILV
jgi:hypothetical protein